MTGVASDADTRQAFSLFSKRRSARSGAPGLGRPGEGFIQWRRFSQRQAELDAGGVVQGALRMRVLSDGELAAYRAPFPSRDYQAGALTFPRLVPIRPDHPGAYENWIAIERLAQLEIPVLLPWGDGDSILGKLEPEMRTVFRNVALPLIVHGAGHFIQEDAGAQVAGSMRNWLETSS